MSQPPRDAHASLFAHGFAFRLAWQLDPRLLQDFTCREGDHILIQERPQDLRKPCLEHLMNLAAQGEAPAEEIFRRIGLHLAQASRELDFLLHPTPRARYLFGRFVKNPRVFALLREGFDTAAPGLTLEAADDTLARTPLMEQLSRRADATVAQFGQAVGAIYFSAMEEHSHETQ